MFAFDENPASCGRHIALSNNNLTARKSGSSYESIIANTSFRHGQHYWEMRIDHYREPEDIWIGVCRKPLDVNSNSPPLSGNFWSLLCSHGSRCLTSRESGYYHPITADGDRVGVLLDTENGTLSYFHNDQFIGEAFHDLPRNTDLFPAVNLYYETVQVTLVFPRRPPSRAAGSANWGGLDAEMEQERAQHREADRELAKRAEDKLRQEAAGSASASSEEEKKGQVIKMVVE